MSQNSVAPIPPAPPPPPPLPPPKYDTVPRPAFTQIRGSELHPRRDNETTTGVVAAVTSSLTQNFRSPAPLPPSAFITPTQNNRTSNNPLLSVVPPAQSFPNGTGTSPSIAPPSYQHGTGTTASVIPVSPNYNYVTGSAATLPPSVPHYCPRTPTTVTSSAAETQQNETPIANTVAETLGSESRTTTPSVIVTQPDTKSLADSHSTKTLDLPYPQNQRGWTTGLFDCFSDCSVCILGMCCYYCMGWQIATSLGESPCTACCCGGLVPMRTKLRSILGISGTIENDCCVICWCPECAICQMQRELKKRGLA